MPCLSTSQLIAQYGPNWQNFVTINSGPHTQSQTCTDFCIYCNNPSIPYLNGSPALCGSYMDYTASATRFYIGGRGCWYVASNINLPKYEGGTFADWSIVSNGCGVCGNVATFGFLCGCPETAPNTVYISVLDANDVGWPGSPFDWQSATTPVPGGGPNPIFSIETTKTEIDTWNADPSKTKITFVKGPCPTQPETRCLDSGGGWGQRLCQSKTPLNFMGTPEWECCPEGEKCGAGPMGMSFDVGCIPCPDTHTAGNGLCCPPGTTPGWGESGPDCL